MSNRFRAKITTVTEALSRSGVKHGDSVLLHSSLRNLGKVDKSDVPVLCEALLNGLLDLLGSDGTLLVPAYFYEYARYGVPFDVTRSPVSKRLGTFSAYIAAHPQSIRSKNPTTSMAAIGAKAEYICARSTATGYGHGSPWALLTEVGGTIAGIGTHFNTMTYIHYIEQIFGVPHMYHKYFTTPIYDDGTPLNMPVINYVRYLKYGIKAEMLKFENELQEKKCVRFETFDDSHVYSAPCKLLLEEGLRKLQLNPFYFLEHAPEFREGEIPMV